jgi:RimJ/RimL family protein N-acetyltransferase
MRMLAIPIRLRRAVAEDCKSIWESANDPEVRAASFSSGRISWETHVEWYSAKMRDPHCFWYIAADEIGNTLGQIRFQMTGLEGTISVSLVPAARGRGYGPAIILRGAEQFFAASNVHTVHAYIKMDNHASVTAFERADFTDAGTAEVAGHRTRHFVFHKRALT